MDFGKNIKGLLLMVFLLSLVFIADDFYGEKTAQAGVSHNISGYAWSDTVGWISFNCTDENTCGSVDYGVNADEDTGVLSGYAWNDAVGWISFNTSDLSGCPVGTCSATLSGGDLVGWAKALSADGNGWDGFIRLFDGSPANYGVSVSAGAFSGYAWGSDVVGWIDFSPSFGGVVLSGANPSLSFDANPNPIERGDDVTLTWNVEDVTSCDADGGWSGSKSASDGSHQETVGPINSDTDFTITCDGLYGSEEVEVSVSVLDADFSLQKAGDVEVQLVSKGGDSTATTITVDSISGFSSAVQLEASSAISGATYTFSDDSLNNSEYGTGTTFSVTLPELLDEGTYPITITGTSASLERTVTVNLFVNRAVPTFEEI